MEKAVKKLRVLVACEYSGTVRDAFIKLGHEAVSCDLLPTDRPGPHYLGDVRDILGDGWDLMIAHPPCQFLAVSGARWLYNKDGSKNLERWENREKALDFVRELMAADIPHIAIENPVSVISSEIRKPDQIIQPYMFGHLESKATCLWLKGLPKLVETDNVKEGMDKLPTKERNRIHYMPPGEERWKLRSITFNGIAEAMAKQWSDYLGERHAAKV